MSSYSHYAWAEGRKVGDPVAKALLIFIAMDTNPLEYRSMAARGCSREDPMEQMLSYFMMLEIPRREGVRLVRKLLREGHLIENFGYVPAWPEPMPVPRTGQMAPKRRRIFERDGWKCVYCGSKERLTIDHVLARSRGGDDLESNLATACHSCNSSKSNKPVESWTPLHGYVGDVL